MGLEEANGTQNALQEIVVKKIPLQCIVWVADLTFVTVELIGVKNPDNKCVLAIKMWSKTKETICLSSAYRACREVLSLQLKADNCSTQSNLFSALSGHLISPVLLCLGKDVFNSFTWPVI